MWNRSPVPKPCLACSSREGTRRVLRKQPLGFFSPEPVTLGVPQGREKDVLTIPASKRMRPIFLTRLVQVPVSAA